jgi:pyrophosphate--fructose-6-phosphate 1-phosphotransferase
MGISRRIGMPTNQTMSIEDILKHPEVSRSLADTNSEIKERQQYVPPKCEVFSSPVTRLRPSGAYHFEIDREAQKQLPKIIDNQVEAVEGVGQADQDLQKEYTRPRTIGIVFSGGPAPGGHNVIAGLYDAAKQANPQSKVYGFLMGPDGIIENEAVILTDELVDQYRNLGGFTMIKTGRTKIDTPQKMALSKETCKNLGLDALVIVGGDDSNTNAAFLAQDLFDHGIQVIGVPKTIDGDIQVRDANGHILCAISFGFHTAARAFASSIGNLCTDSSSDVKYWHICKVMGRVASHLALEVALQTHANMTLIGEELADYVDEKRLEDAKQKGEIFDFTAYGMTLRHLSRLICDGIVRRAAVGKNYGVAVIPEGILEFINEIQVFIIKLNTIIAQYNAAHDDDFHTAFPTLDEKLEHLRKLAKRSREESQFAIWNTRDDDLFDDIPAFFQEGLLLERDSHGNFQFSQVPTDRVLLEMVQDYLNILAEKGIYKVGIERRYYEKTVKKAGLDPDYYGSVLFKNYADGAFLLVKEDIMSMKTLRQALVDAQAIEKGASIPAVIEKIYQKSVPKFKTQSHFYGYDGRGNDPTRFDCDYTYNLGWTVFSLIANRATGQMASIKNLEKTFDEWQPIGIPIAPLMHLEERKGRLALVIEKSVVSVDSAAFRVYQACREKWLAAVPSEDHYRRPGPVRFTGKSEESRPITLVLNAIGSEE